MKVDHSSDYSRVLGLQVKISNGTDLKSWSSNPANIAWKTQAFDQGGFGFGR